MAFIVSVKHKTFHLADYILHHCIFLNTLMQKFLNVLKIALLLLLPSVDNTIIISMFQSYMYNYHYSLHHYRDGIYCYTHLFLTISCLLISLVQQFTIQSKWRVSGHTTWLHSCINFKILKHGPSNGSLWDVLKHC